MTDNSTGLIQKRTHIEDDECALTVSDGSIGLIISKQIAESDEVPEYAMVLIALTFLLDGNDEVIPGELRDKFRSVVSEAIDHITHTMEEEDESASDRD